MDPPIIFRAEWNTAECVDGALFPFVILTYRERGSPSFRRAIGQKGEKCGYSYFAMKCKLIRHCKANAFHFIFFGCFRRRSLPDGPCTGRGNVRSLPRIGTSYLARRMARDWREWVKFSIDQKSSNIVLQGRPFNSTMHRCRSRPLKSLRGLLPRKVRPCGDLAKSLTQGSRETHHGRT